MNAHERLTIEAAKLHAEQALLRPDITPAIQSRLREIVAEADSLLSDDLAHHEKESFP